MKYKRILMAAALCLAAVLPIEAQNINGEGTTADGFKLNLEFQPFIASNWGATTSLGVPAETREIGSAEMNWNWAVGCYVSQMLTQRWGVRSGLVLERKGSNSNVVMKDYFTKVRIDNAPNETQGYFCGRSKTWHDCLYLTLPVLGMYRLSDQWDFHAGPYFSYAVSRSRHDESSEGTIRQDLFSPVAPVNHSTNDSSDKINRFDCGLQLGLTHPIWRQLMFEFDLDWGLVNVWDGRDYGMTMNIYNLYARMGLGWQF